MAGRSYAYFGWVFDRPEPVGSLNEIVSGTDPVANTFFMEHAAHFAKASVPVQMTRCMAEFVARFLNGDPDAASKDFGTEGAAAEDDPKTIHHLKKGVERFWITDTNNPAGAAKAASEIWVMMDRFCATPDGSMLVFNHVPGGSNVLYLDGHVQFVRYPSEPPLVKPVGEMMPVIDALSGRKPAS